MQLLQVYAETDNSSYWSLWTGVILASVIWLAILYWLISAATKSKEVLTSLSIQNKLLAEIAKKQGVEDVQHILTNTTAQDDIIVKFDNSMMSRSYDSIKTEVGECNESEEQSNGSVKRIWIYPSFSITLLFDKRGVAQRILSRTPLK